LFFLNRFFLLLFLILFLNYFFNILFLDNYYWCSDSIIFFIIIFTDIIQICFIQYFELRFILIKILSWSYEWGCYFCWINIVLVYIFIVLIFIILLIWDDCNRCNYILFFLGLLLLLIPKWVRGNRRHWKK
jgi:hypothetical protein